MKFKLGSSKNDPMRIERGPGGDHLRPHAPSSSGKIPTPPTGYGRSSGLYDVSRMTGVKSPVNPVGHNASYYTRTQGAELERRAEANSDLVRGLLTAIAVPLVVGAAYLMFSGHKPEIPALTEMMPAHEPAVLDEPMPDRAPAARATLPVPKAFDPQVALAPTMTVMNADGLSKTGELYEPRLLRISLDANGKMASPFSVELDADGNEVGRKELEEHLVFADPLPLGEFENARILSATLLPPGQFAVTRARPFMMTEAERRRLSELRLVVPEIRKAFREADLLTNARLRSAPFAIESFNSTRVSKSIIDEGLKELRWLHQAAIVHDLQGDTATEKRMMDTIMLWAKTYKPSGLAREEAPLLELVYAYNQVRHLWRMPDQSTLDVFFRTIVDAQFARLKAQKQYDTAHALHTLFSLAIGYATDNGAFQKHGLYQYRTHLEKAGWLKQDTFGGEDVLTLKALLRSAFTLERSGNPGYQDAELNRAVDVLASATQAHSKDVLLEAIANAAYFRPDLYKTLAELSTSAGVEGSRFGTNDGAILAAIRKPDSSLVPRTSGRTPSGHSQDPAGKPLKLPPKRR